MASLYEQKRLERIQANEAFLASLDVDLDNKSKRIKIEKKSKPIKEKTQPSRQSSRLRGIKAEIPEGVSMELNSKADRVSIIKEEKQERFTDESLVLASSKDFFANLKENVELPKADLTYAESLSKMECSRSFKAVPSRIYSLSFHSSQSIIFAGDKEGNMAMLNYSTGDKVDYRPHTATINVIETVDLHKLYSFSYDGTIRCMDLIVPDRFDLIFATEPKSEEWIQYGTVVDSNTICFCLSNGYVHYYDIRSGSVTMKWQAHEKKVQTVSVHGHNLVTASLDRTIKIWDARKKKSFGMYEDQLSVSSCFFNASGNKLIATSMTNHLRLFVDPVKSLDEPTHNVRHDNRTGRWLSVFHATWDPKYDNGIIVGSMAQPRRVECFSAESNKLVLVSNLQSDCMNSVQSRNQFHPRLPVIACGNASGHVHIYKRKH